MRRFLSAFLVFSLICSSFVLPSFAADREPVLVKDVILDYSMVDTLDSYLLDAKLVDLTGKIPFVDMESAFWGIFDRMVSISGYGRFETYKDLLAACSAVNSYFNNPNPSIWDLDDIVDRAIVAECLNGLYKYTEWKVTPHYQYGYVISEVNTGAILCNSRGEFPYYLPTTTDSDTGEEVADPALGGKWVRMDKVAGVKNVVSEAVLDDLVVALVTAGETVRYSEVEGKWKGIQSKTRFENGIPFVYCDSKSRQYVQQLDPDEFAVNNNQNIFIEDDDGDGIFDDGETKENQFIDIDSNTIWFPDGTLNFINNLVYDESQKTYYVDASSSYDIDNNYYYTYNYHYEYHIDYTSITYIGQTAEYDEVYEYYYQLPDGRSSADLTAEELQALNTQIDVLPYIRSADDTSIRALYHFDGDTRDSSYWSHLGEFKWNKGASITYMDAGAFNGALYLDETAHNFSVTLPSILGSGDWTVQFRYYQSHTLTPVTDSSITIGGVKVATMDGSEITVGGTSAPISVGQWQELAFMCSGGQYHFFHNGVLISSVSTTAVCNDTIDFVFGADQQTYKYFDELRVTNKALYPTTGYSPTSVPYDTNLALVLPDSQLPVADEYWSFDSSGENLLTPYGLDNWIAPVLSEMSLYDPSAPYEKKSSAGKTWYMPGPSWNVGGISYPVKFEDLGYFNSNVLRLYSVGDYSGAYFEFSSSVTDPSARASISSISSSQIVSIPVNGFTIPIMLDGSTTSISDRVFVLGSGGTYTFSMVSADGEIGSLTFTLPSKLSTTHYSKKLLFNGYTIEFGSGQRSNSTDTHASRLYWVSVYPTEAGVPGGDFVYWELVNADSTDLTAEFVSSVVVMDKDDLNTPSLAVRTDLDITGYQIGGVRPSLPTKGLVWALVEAGRISSLQIYNGQAWEEVDGRIWTGSRWVPYYAYDVLLLKDMWDIVEADPSLNPIYTEAGFWKWLQEAWGEMMKKLDQIIVALGGTPSTGESCSHTYESKISREATCSEPGHMTYTCSQCGHKYTELIDAHGHDWTVVNSVPDVLDENGSVIEEGYEELVCTVCDTQSRDYGEGPEEVEFFDAVGDFIADGITWILDKLEELADSLRGITEIFNSFRDRISGMAGGFPLFFAGIVALFPEDLMAVLWFFVIGWIVLKVWKKWSN